MKRLIVGLLIIAVGVGLVTSYSSLLFDVDRGNSGLQAGKLDVAVDGARHLSSSDGLLPGQSLVISLPVSNPGTLPLRYQVTATVVGDLEDVVEVVVPKSSGRLKHGEQALVDVHVSLPWGVRGDAEGQTGNLAVKVAATTEPATGFSDQELSSNMIRTAVAPPSVHLLMPANGADVFGEVVIEAEAADNFQVASVNFYVDNLQIGAVGSAPYRVTWGCTADNAGLHTVTAEVVDAIGQSSQQSIQVNCAPAVP